MELSEMERLDATTAALNEARILVVEFLEDVEARQYLSITQAASILQHALKKYTIAITLIEGNGIGSVVSFYYTASKADAQFEKRMVQAMFKAVVKQDVAHFNRFYAAYVRKLLPD